MPASSSPLGVCAASPAIHSAWVLKANLPSTRLSLLQVRQRNLVCGLIKTVSASAAGFEAFCLIEGRNQAPGGSTAVLTA